MLDASTFTDVVSGRRRGLSAAVARSALRLAEAPYSLAVRCRNWRFDSGRAEIVRVGAAVVSVGNLTLGGTGKTPMVAWLARWFLDRGVRVGIVSRGYGGGAGGLSTSDGGDVGSQFRSRGQATSGPRLASSTGSANVAGPNDEARELAARLPDVPHVQNRDRVAAAREAIDRCGCRAIVMDDGFQHRRLARDLDIVLLDATEPFGFEHVFPRGTLREPVEALRRAHVAVLTRSDLVSAERREVIRRRALEIAPQIAWLESIHAPRELVSAAGESRGLDWLVGRRVAAFCGIGNPAAFEQTLRACGASVVGFCALADHFDYAKGSGDGTPIPDQLGNWAKSVAADVLVATCKDLAKLPHAELGGVPLWALSIDLAFTAGQKLLDERLSALLPSLTPAPRPPTPVP